jgi:excisionase family DNA binding protein
VARLSGVVDTTSCGGEEPGTIAVVEWREDPAATMRVQAGAEHLGVSVRRVYELVDEAELPAYKNGPRIMLRPDDVEAYRRAHAGD